MILDISLSCILKTGVLLVEILEKIRYRKKRLGVYVPEELKGELVKFLANYTQVAILDIDTEIFTMIKTEDRQKVLADKSLQKVVREKLIKLTFKEYCQHFDKLIYISSNPQLIRSNFKNKLFLVPHEIFMTANPLKTYNKELLQLLVKEKDIKKDVKSFDSISSLLNIMCSKIC